MTQSKTDHFLLLLLRLGAFLCFVGWTWVHFYWEGPYGILLWHDDTYALAERFGVSWEEFVGSGADDGFIQKWIARISWLYLACTLLTLMVRKNSRIMMVMLFGGSGLLAILAFCKYLSVREQLPMLIEHGGQILSPVLLVMALRLGVRHRVTVFTAIAACVMTFAGHGAYALGLFWPTPANFLALTTVILQVDHEAARNLLHLAGTLDFLVCIGLFVPVLRRASALYAAIWGFLTAIARPVAGMSLSLNYWGADQFLQEAILRAPHFMIPLYLFILWRTSESAETLAPPLQPEPSPNHPLVAGTFLTDKTKTQP